MRCLITGGAGFIGSAVVDRLLADGHEVIVVDDLRRGRAENLTAAFTSGRCALLRTSVTTTRFREVVVDARPEVVLHLAAQVDVRASVADPIADARLNVLGTLNVAEAARLAGCRKVVFASSGGSIYGAAAVLPVAETAPLRPHSPYAAAKAACEIYLDTYRRLHGLECTHLAPANVYGPRQDDSGETGVVAVFARALLRGEPTTVFGDGGNTRDYVFVDDVADAFALALGHGGDGLRLNIGTGVQTTDRALHTRVAAAAGVPDRPDAAPARAGDLRRSALACSAAARELGWKPQVDLAEGVRRTVEHIRAH